MHFGFALELPDMDLWNIDLLDTYLDTDIPSKDFVCLHNVLKRSSRHVFKTSLRHVFRDLNSWNRDAACVPKQDKYWNDGF